MSDEEVIRRRLMIDGDGTGDDRRLNMFLKHLTKWALSEDGGEKEGSLTCERLLSQLSQCEFSIAKSQQDCAMNTAELDNYESLYTKIDAGTETVKAEIVEAKEELTRAKQVRRNRMEYDALAKVIAQQPDRQRTETRLAELKAELETLQVGSAPRPDSPSSRPSWRPSRKLRTSWTTSWRCGGSSSTCSSPRSISCSGCWTRTRQPRTRTPEPPVPCPSPERARSGTGLWT